MLMIQIPPGKVRATLRRRFDDEASDRFRRANFRVYSRVSANPGVREASASGMAKGVAAIAFRRKKRESYGFFISLFTRDKKTHNNALLESKDLLRATSSPPLPGFAETSRRGTIKLMIYVHERNIRRSA